MKKNYKHVLMGNLIPLKTNVNSMSFSNWGIKKFSGKLLLSILCLAFSAGAFAQATQAPANPNTNRSARIVLNYFRTLKNMAGSGNQRLISGQFQGYNDNLTNQDARITTVYNRSNKWVGIVGGDYASQPNDNPNYYTINYDFVNPRLISAWNAGHYATIQVHFKSPVAGASLKTPLNATQYAEVITPGTTLYNSWRAQLSTVADGLQQLEDAGVVVIFRPLHEMNGSWFWWGGDEAKNSGRYKTLWQQMFNYLTVTRGLDNLLFVFAPNISTDPVNKPLIPSDYYPGDNYVDLLGLDAYTSTITTSKFSGVTAMLGIDKPLGLSEYGPVGAVNPPTPLTFQYTTLTDGLAADANLKKMVYFHCWNANWGLDVNPSTLTPTVTGVAAALSHSSVANRDNIAKVSNFKPANANASTKAQGVLNYITGLRSQSDRYLVSGQFTGYSDGPGYQKITDIYNNNATNKYVGIVSSDYSNSTFTTFNSTTYAVTNTMLTSSWNAGHLVMLQASMPNPKYTSGHTETRFKEKISLLEVMPGGLYHTNWLAELDILAAGLQVLENNNVMVLFRPFHKMNAVGQVWYNNTNTQYFKDAWKFMFNYLTYTKGLNNLLWVFSPDMNTDAASYYPGDDYVDITSLNVDITTTALFNSTAIPGYSDMVALGKPFGISEFRPMPNTGANYNYHDWFISSLKTLSNGLRDVSFFVCMDGNSGLNTNVKVKEALTWNACVANRDNIPNLKSATIPNSGDKITIEDPSANEVKVYPNPVEKGNSLNLRFEGLTNGDRLYVKVFNVVGNLMSQQTLPGSESNLYEVKSISGLNEGIYILKAEGATKTANIRFVVK